ncbi:MAG: NTP transferase domain-containing protein [Gemmatimonadetes bacterium]|nr:NTP transferase domain-containing protein [Gemmatimonadota bacterium]MYG86491.1 NTP transferase domain-containing protein [Gemmatimonadota bacterium]MYJ89925.1 NTP transferase domain-containing protein [Gemmatimonadota bacterium]
MKAMILAAGLGTRLRPLTDARPKALVEVAGRPMLYWVIARLARHGFNDIIINAHHFAEQIEAFAAAYDSPGVSLTVSVEEEILDTGGGVRMAAWFFHREEPFLVHNVDVLTDLDLSALMTAHRASEAGSACGARSAPGAHRASEAGSASGALVTVAVKKRKSTRHLLFDEAGRLGGWRSDITGETRTVRPMEGPVTSLPFMGVYVMSLAALGKMTGSGSFSIIDFFLDLAGTGSPIQAFRAEEARWADLGSVDRIAAAERLFGKDWFADFG